MVVLSGQPNVEVGLQRSRHLLGKKRAHGLARHPADHLTHQIPLGDGVVTRSLTRLPPGCLGGQQRGGLLPVVEIVGLDGGLPSGQSGRVAHEVADFD